MIFSVRNKCDDCFKLYSLGLPHQVCCGKPMVWEPRNEWWMCYVCASHRINPILRPSGTRSQEGWDGGLLYKLIGNPEAEEAAEIEAYIQEYYPW